MQKRPYEQYTPLAIAHLMGRPAEFKDEGPVRFRVQADRRQVEALAQGEADRRVRRVAVASTTEGADAMNGTAQPGSSKIGQDT
jgi:hypothetical protein